MSNNEFIEEIAKYVKKYAHQFGICVYSPIIAQACLESDYGRSRKAKFNNYFGLKYRKNRVSCNNGYMLDGGSEQNLDGSYTLLPSDTAWYSFDSMEKCVLGYFQFINISAYNNLKGVTDQYQYLVNIKADNYATSNDYVANVYRTLTSNNLTRFDANIVSTKYIVAIDAGHGSNTGGKRTPDGYREHWINVMCAGYCETALKRCGIDVIRVAWDDNNAKDDVDTPLKDRQNIIKSSACIVSASFHANAFGDGKSYNDANGVETLIHNNPSYVGDSRNLATLVQNHLLEGTKQSDRGVKTQELALCNCKTMGTKASVLVEVGFMTNKAESELMMTEKFCHEQAEEVAHGICDYLGVKYTGCVYNPSSSTITSNTQSSKFPYTVRVTTDVLRVRAGAGTNYDIVTKIKDRGIYTIVAESNNWGRLKSGAGWISLEYTEKIIQSNELS